jgi:alpha-mannosidase
VVLNGALKASVPPNGIRTYAVKLAPPAKTLPAIHFQTVDLKYDLATASEDGIPAQSGFDAIGQTLPAEMLPVMLPYGGIQFHLGPAWTNRPNAVVARGQTLKLPEGNFNRVYILAAADGDQNGTFRIGDSAANLNIQDWQGFIGQWDTRTWTERRVEVPTPPEPAPGDHSYQAERNRRIRAQVQEHGPRTRLEPEYTGLIPGFIKPASVAWYASHHHTAQGANEPYNYCYLYAYTLPLKGSTLTLPDNSKIRIMAITVADEAGWVQPVQPLVDTLEVSGRR